MGRPDNQNNEEFLDLVMCRFVDFLNHQIAQSTDQQFFCQPSFISG
jgi:hypothetical protein